MIDLISECPIILAIFWTDIILSKFVIIFTMKFYACVLKIFIDTFN